jgi:hypothetical protein
MMFLLQLVLFRASRHTWDITHPTEEKLSHKTLKNLTQTCRIVTSRATFGTPSRILDLRSNILVLQADSGLYGVFGERPLLRGEPPFPPGVGPSL